MVRSEYGLADLRRLDRSDVNDTPFATLSDCAAAVYLRAEPRRAQVDIHEPRPLIVSQLEKRHDGFYSGIVDQDVKTAEFMPSLLDHRVDITSLRDVAYHRDRVPPFCARGRDYFIYTPGIGDVVDRNIGSFVGKNL